uniref:Caspase recruitment domain-containing protein n=1 Tax=Eptatretus burgeri TaxID=7764 RepID=A0A8C4WUA9_EPTBU
MDDPMDDWRRRNMKYFMNMDAAVLLPHLVCLTDHERDIILKRARFENCLDAMTCLLDDVHRRWKQSSYQQLLQALNHCEYKEIAQEMERELIRVNLSSESSGTYRSGNYGQTRNASKLSEPPSSQNAASIHHSMSEMARGSGSQEQRQKEKVSYSLPDATIVHPQFQTYGTAAVSVSKQNEGLSTGENVIPAGSTGKTSPCSEINDYPIGVKEVGMVESPGVASSKSENLKPHIKSETVAHTNVTHSENIDLRPALDAPAVETNAREGGDMAVPEESDEKPEMLMSHAYSSLHLADLQISTMTTPGISERPDPECTVTRPNDDQMESLSAEHTCANSQTQDGNDSVNRKRQKIDALQGYQNWERDDDDNNFSRCDQSFDTAQNVSNFSGFGDLSYNDLTPAMKIKEPNEEKMQNIPNKTKANGEELIRVSTGDEACKNTNNISEFYVSTRASPEHKEDYQAQPGVGEGISQRRLTSSLTEDAQSQIPSGGEPVDNCCWMNRNVHNPRFSNFDSFSGHAPGDEKGSWLPYLIVTAMFCVALIFIKQRYKSS